MNSPAFLRFHPSTRSTNGLNSRLKSLAIEHGLGVAAVTSANEFDGLAEILDRHIDAGHTEGFDWFTHDRAHFSTNPVNLHPTARSIISLGIPYWSGPAEKPTDVPRGRISRYAWNADYHNVLKTRMKHFHVSMERELGRSIEARFLVDTARIVDRAAAARAGLGWYGKHSCLIVPGHGSWVMLGNLLVDIELEPEPSLERNCGRCSICIDRCPTGAIVAPYVVSAPLCLSYQTIEQRGAIPIELRCRLGDWVFGCDVCQDVCPYTGAASIVDDPDFRPANLDRAFPGLEWLLNMTEAEFRSVFRGSAVLRTKRSGLARNAAVALGNIGGEGAVPALTKTLNEHDLELVRSHAAWALGNIGGRAAKRALEGATAKQTLSIVRHEIRMALERQ